MSGPRRDVAKVVLLDLLPGHEEIVEYVHAGASGFIVKDTSLEGRGHAHNPGAMRLIAGILFTVGGVARLVARRHPP